ncbi:MAG: TIGR04219 family outer membrane beta-barrel protein [Halioglobus sp.]
MLKKNILWGAGALLATSMATGAYADTLGGTVGINLWAQEYDARARDGGDFINFDSSFDVDDEADYQIYFSIEHPVPVIPNLLVQHTRSSTEGNGVIGSTIFDGVELEGEVTGELQLTHTDATLYYEVLDNWLNLDLGLTARKFDANVELTSLEGITASADADDILPLLYVRAQIDLPFTGWKIRASGNYVNYDGDSLSDMTGAVGWEVFAGLELELGYRLFDIDYSDGDELVDAQVEGFYGGVVWDF